MKKEDFEKEENAGNVEVVQPAKRQKPLDPNAGKQELFDIAYILEGLKVTHKPVSVAPTFTPRNFSEQIQIYENGATYRLYIYVNQTWRYVALT